MFKRTAAVLAALTVSTAVLSVGGPANAHEIQRVTNFDDLRDAETFVPMVQYPLDLVRTTAWQGPHDGLRVALKVRNMQGKARRQYRERYSMALFPRNGVGHYAVKTRPDGGLRVADLSGSGVVEFKKAPGKWIIDPENHRIVFFIPLHVFNGRTKVAALGQAELFDPVDGDLALLDQSRNGRTYLQLH